MDPKKRVLAFAVNKRLFESLITFFATCGSNNRQTLRKETEKEEENNDEGDQQKLEHHKKNI